MKFINRDLFPGDLSARVEEYPVTIISEGGHEIEIIVKKLILTSGFESIEFENEVYFQVSHSLNFEEIIGGSGLSAGYHSYAPCFTYVYTRQSGDDGSLYIRLIGNDKLYFLIGVNPNW